MQPRSTSRGSQIKHSQMQARFFGGNDPNPGGRSSSVGDMDIAQDADDDDDDDNSGEKQKRGNDS